MRADLLPCEEMVVNLLTGVLDTDLRVWHVDLTCSTCIMGGILDLALDCWLMRRHLW